MILDTISSSELRELLQENNILAAAGYALLTFSALLFFRYYIIFIIARLRRFSHAAALTIMLQQLRKVPAFIEIVLITYVFLTTSDIALSTTIIAALEVILLSLLVFFGARVINATIRVYLAKKAHLTLQQSKKTALSYFSVASRTIVWVLAGVGLLQNIGIDVSALVAGLGLSGFAIAFALRSLIKDMLASLVILFEQPIQLGDRIVVAKKRGYVKKVGIKSTVLIQEDGREIVLPNSFITEKAVKNYKGDEARDISLELTVKKHRKKKSIIPGLKETLSRFDFLITESIYIHTTRKTDEAVTYYIEFQLMNNEQKDSRLESIFSTLESSIREAKLTLQNLQFVDKE